MKRGFPRPTVFLDLLGPGYDEKWNGQRYPMPYTSRDDRISLIDENRAGECVRKRLCFVCGVKVDGDPWVLYHPDKGSGHGEAGPYHEVCVEITIKRCPHVAENGFLMVQMSYDELEDDTKDFW